MNNLCITALCMIFFMSFVACKGVKDKPKEPPSPLESAGEKITGEALTGEYLKILCSKYQACGIKAFQDDPDCHRRIQAVLDKDAKWKELEMEKKALKLCLADFKAFACDEFKSGKSPESCMKF